MFERSEFVSHPTATRRIWEPAEGGQRLCDRFFAYFLAEQKVSGCRAAPGKYQRSSNLIE